MKQIKFVTLGLGALFLIAVFLPFVNVEGMKMSLWAAKAFKAGPTYIALLGAVAVLGLSALAVKGRLSRGIAAGIAVASLIVAVIALIQFEASMPLMKVGGIGAKILVFGGVASFLAGLVALIKPEKA
jgi:quinol-cytochrome oxidoreductase complex cytochrome b subunit